VVFVLREIEGMRTDETAAALDLGESAVKVRLHRARLRLRELLAGYLATEGDGS
jgi:RNA polymerase sigma-70 factor (ECF subfamily)